MSLSATQMSMTPDRRRLRSDVLAHQVLHALEPWIERLDALERALDCDEKKQPLPKHRRDIYRALFDLFYAVGVEVITDADRAAAGLDHRNERGLTDRELQIMEDRIAEAMLRPMPPMIVSR